MGAAHTGNQGYIGKQISRAVYDGPAYGVWQQSTVGLNLAQYTFDDPTPVSTDTGYSHDEPDSNNEYVYSSRNLTIFYEDAYGTTTHLDRTSGVAGSYDDARHIGNNNGIADAHAVLVKANDAKIGYKWVDNARIKGFKAHGKYSTRTFSNNGTLDILAWDGSIWSTVEANVDITAGGTVDWGTSTIQTYNFVNGSVVCKGLAVQCNDFTTYWPVNYFAPIDVNDAIFLGHT